MDDAWMRIGKGKLTTITAHEFQRRFNGPAPGGVHLFCPICEQPLSAVSMRRYSETVPYFRHEKNNPQAQECERFASGYGGLSEVLYQRMPIPMLIRPRSLGSMSFIVEGEFRTPNSKMLSLLSADSAKLVVGTKRFNVDGKRFVGGAVRIPFDELTLKPAELITLEETSVPIQQVWGPPQMGISALVFTRDEFTGQGRRVRRGEFVEFGDPIYLLVPLSDLIHVTDTFSSSRRVGRVEHRLGGHSLAVVTANVPDKPGVASAPITFLLREGISIRKRVQKTSVVWPPSLIADGEVRPVLKSSKMVFATTESPKQIYVHEGTAVVDDFTPYVSGTVGGSAERFAVLNTPQTDVILNTEKDEYANAIVVGTLESEAIDNLDGYTLGFELDADDEKVSVRFKRSYTLQVHRKGSPSELLKDKNKQLVIAIRPGDVIRVTKRLNARSGTVVLAQVVREGSDAIDVFEDDETQAISIRTRGKDVAFAQQRKRALRPPRPSGTDRTIAKARRGH